MYVFISNVTEYTGPGLVSVLADKGYDLICHDVSFRDEGIRIAYEREHQVSCLSAQSPEEILFELSEYGQVDRFIFNDVHANTPKPYEAIDANELREAFEALLVFPFSLSRLLLPALKEQEKGHILFVTSARQLKPEPGFAVATSIRSATTAMALSLATEVASFNIQVNVLQPNYLYSEMYYPKAKFKNSKEGREEIANAVPLGRLGEPEEFGELAELFISGRSAFTTGQVINFTGGWP